MGHKSEWKEIERNEKKYDDLNELILIGRIQCRYIFSGQSVRWIHSSIEYAKHLTRARVRQKQLKFIHTISKVHEKNCKKFVIDHTTRARSIIRFGAVQRSVVFALQVRIRGGKLQSMTCSPSDRSIYSKNIELDSICNEIKIGWQIK